MSLQDDIFEVETFFEQHPHPDSYEAEKAFSRITDRLGQLDQIAEELLSKNNELKITIKTLTRNT